MLAREIMTTPVITVSATMPVSEVATLMSKERISGAPVISGEGQVVGIVSETDLLHRPETGTEKRRKWWLSLMMDAETLARDYVKTHGRTASDIMSRYVISVPDTAPLALVADLLERNNIKRVPVLKDGKLAGIITRGDLVRALAMQQAEKAPRLDDAALQKTILERIEAQPWLVPNYISAIVVNGNVELWGFVGSESQRKALLVLVEEAGAASIKDHLKVGGREHVLYGGL